MTRVSGSAGVGSSHGGARVVITLRQGVRMDRDVPAQGLKRVLTYTYLGEGVAVTWHHEHLEEMGRGVRGIVRGLMLIWGGRNGGWKCGWRRVEGLGIDGFPDVRRHECTVVAATLFRARSRGIGPVGTRVALRLNSSLRRVSPRVG
jgi:hypothetical protein